MGKNESVVHQWKIFPYAAVLYPTLDRWVGKTIWGLYNSNKNDSLNIIYHILIYIYIYM